MEITYFALGMLSMVALFFIGVIVWGVFKVMKIENQIVGIKESHRFDVDNIQRQFDNVYRSIGEVRDDSYRGIHEFNKDVHKKIENIEGHHNIKFDEISRMVNDMYNDACKYTDRRFDKAKPQKEVL
jgi:hypothetical protein